MVPLRMNCASRDFSVLLDLDRLDEADRISRFFSVNKFNLISFHEADFGPNHKSQRTKTGSLISLSAYIRSLAEDYFDPAQIKNRDARLPSHPGNVV